MHTLSYNDMSWSVDHAVKGSNYVHGYASDGRIIIAIEDTSDFANIEYDGVYLSPDECLPELCNEVRHVGENFVRRDGTIIGPVSLIAEYEKVLLKEASYDGFFEVEEGSGVYIYAFGFALKDGETYHIIWGTQDFTAKASLTQDAAYIGNLALAEAGDDTGEPFLMIADGTITYIFTAETDSSHYIGVYHKTYPARLPGVTSLDDGKMLKVVDGVWTVVDDTQRVTDIVNAVIDDALGGVY